MKKTLKYSILFVLIGLFSACSDDKFEDSIFDTTPPVRTAFDKWLTENYVKPYNIEVKYRLEDIETDMKYSLVPASLDKSKIMVQIIKYAWLEAYNEAANVEFTKAIAPKVIHLIGSPGYNNNGSYLQGTAEGGVMITLYDINGLTIPIDPAQVKYSYFHVMHHEFAHILHQKINYDPLFKTISDGDYVADEWVQSPYKDLAYALQRGFISPYAQTYPDEDFVETFSRYLIYTDAEWDYLMSAAGAQGAAIIGEKLDVVRKYLDSSWDIKLDVLKTAVQTRSDELPTLVFEQF
ncbi:putative zinc-binding metallopeptidase [Dysgonomonas sp. 511]|uniref:zinc-binding metallopeptidase n=1 Tax=Dysgonomonas sp. 511 TaxID=2302930 RepID=UPI0013D29201|nr:putative zinc-binding metallopeptidase [Dysgonomonas sp. 511]NDV77672.1 hypothetical protein [Dysgonomonas sp. 511]